MLFLAILVLGLVAIHFGAQSVANGIKANPDPFPLDVLEKDPQGDEAFITRDDGTEIRVVSAGSDGRTVVLAHGYGYTAREWNVTVSSLVDQGYHVIAFDQRGHGKSTIGRDGIGSAQMAGDYDAVMTHYDVQDAILVGHSMGGFLAIVAMLTYPEIQQRLKGVVLFATFAGNVLEGSLQNRVQIPLIRAGIIQWVARTDPYKWLFGMTLMGEKPSSAIIQAFLSVFTEQRHQELLPILHAFGKEDYYNRLSEIQVPCVVVCGELDKTTPRWHSERMGRDLPDATNVWVAGKGHLLNWESHDSLINAIASLEA